MGVLDDLIKIDKNGIVNYAGWLDQREKLQIIHHWQIKKEII